MQRTENGFTLIEALIVVVVIGLLAGILVSMVDPVRSQGQARDGVRYNNIKNLSEIIESYRQAEGRYPLSADPTTPTSVLRTVYLKSWPVGYNNTGGVDEANFGYRYALVGNGVVLYTPNSQGGCYKYQTTWRKVKECPLNRCNLAVSALTDCN